MLFNTSKIIRGYVADVRDRRYRQSGSLRAVAKVGFDDAAAACSVLARSMSDLCHSEPSPVRVLAVKHAITDLVLKLEVAMVDLRFSDEEFADILADCLVQHTK